MAYQGGDNDWRGQWRRMQHFAGTSGDSLKAIAGTHIHNEPQHALDKGAAWLRAAQVNSDDQEIIMHANAWKPRE